MTQREWRKGDFFVVGYAGQDYVFCLMRTSEKGALVFLTENGMALYLKQAHLDNADFICHGTEKWYWKYLPWKKAVCKYKMIDGE